MVTQLLQTAEAQGIRVYMKSGRLHFVARRGAMTIQLREQLQLNRTQILEYLQAVGPVRVANVEPPPASAGIEPVTLSCAQERLWFLDRFEGGSAAYNMAEAYKVLGNLSSSALRSAFHALVERHSVLRTHVTERDGVPFPRIASQFNVSMTELDLSHLTTDERDQALRDLIQQESLHPFDLASDLPLRINLVRFSEQDHRLLVTAHHIALDGWSIATLFEELGSLYDGYLTGRRPTLRALTHQYTDYARWQRQWLTSGQAQEQLDYWKHMLRDLPLLHGLPMDQPRAPARPPVRRPAAGVFLDTPLDRRLLRAVEELCRRSDTTAFMCLHAVFATLVSRYSNQTDMVIGTPVSGRFHRDTEKLIGNFVNTVVLRTDLAGNPTFLELLKTTRARTLEVLEHQQFPFDQLVEHIAQERTPDVNPVFQIMFAFHNFEERPLKLEGLTIEGLGQVPTPAKLDLELHVIQGSGSLSFRWVYNTELFMPESIRRLSEAYVSMIEQVVRQPERRHHELSPVSRAARTRLLVDASGPLQPLPLECTHRLFERQVSKTPQAVAVQFEDRLLSYAECDRVANQLAHRLIAEGVGRGSLVGICLDRGHLLICAIMAIWKAGGAYVPLDRDLPVERLNSILGDAQLKLILTQRTACMARFTLSVPIMYAEEISDCSAAGPAAAPENRAQPQDPAYVIYTSGSTGQPKGAVVRHQGLVNYLSHAARSYMRSQIESSVVSSPLSFDATVTTLFTPLLTGGRVVLLGDGDNALVLSQLAERLFDSNVSRLFKITPAHLDALSAQAGESNTRSQHVVVVGGEQLTSRTLAPWRNQLLPESTFINEYGPTETVVGCAVYEVGPANAMLSGAIPIGRPIQNTQLYVVAPHATSLCAEALQPVGAIGELCIGGAGVAQGYLNRPDLTKSRFVPDPFFACAEASVYRTGDLVRWRADGELEFLGRADHQIKLRGYRIEPGEIETQLRSLAAVHDAFVVDRCDSAGERYLAAYLIPEQHEAFDESALVTACRAHLEKHVPSYMVPAAFVCLREFPLTANGKVDRKALHDPETGDFHRAVYVGSRNEQEQHLCQLWCEVLGVDRVGVHDNFFSLGGHSLKAARLVSLIREHLGVDIKLRDIFDWPNVHGLAHVLASRAQMARPAEATQTALGQRGPLSSTQRRLWFVDRLDGHSTQYNMFGSFRLAGQVDELALRYAADEIVARHESLRTVFKTSSDSSVAEPEQVVRTQRGNVLVERNLSGLDLREHRHEVQRLAREDADRPFDLSRDTLLRITWLKCSDHVSFLLFNVHHIACDGWSVRLLTEDFSQLYAAHAQRLHVKEPASSLRYLDFAYDQHRALQDGRFERELQYWTARLTDLPPVHSLPLRGRRPAVQSNQGRAQSTRLDAALVARLQEYCAARGVTLFMVLETAFAVLLARYSNATDVVLGTVVSGREHEVARDTVGLFVNTVVLRSDLAGNPSFDTLLANSKSMILDAFDHQQLPFDALVEKLRPERSLSYDPLVQVMLTLQSGGNAHLQLTGLNVQRQHSAEQRVKFDLHLDVEDADGCVELHWLYRIELFADDFIRRMSFNFETLLASIVANPAGEIQRLPMLHPSEREILLHELPAVRFEPPRLRTLHAYFEKQALDHPTRVAVRHENKCWTYDELNKLSNRLAHHLAAKGVGPESLVGLCVGPSIGTVVGILGILKAGGGYVPIDPKLPERRINYVLRDAALQIVLTDTSVREELDIQAPEVICIDSQTYLTQSASCPDTNNPDSSRHASSNAAYVIYTSGSTGEPKGVVVEHQNVLSLLDATAESFSFTKHDVWTLFHSHAFDFSVWEIWGALAYGGCLVIVPPGTARDPERFAALLCAERVTVLNQTPQAFYSLQEAMVHSSCTHRLRYIVFGGEALDYAKLARWYDQYGHERTKLINMYGITETTVHVTFSEIHAKDVESPTSIIGRPIASLAALVCNECLELQPIGAIGELLIAGGGVAREYLNKPELTNKRFVVLDAYQSLRFYRSGDLARITDSGALDYVGRIDNQVKIRGFRIEPGEVETQLRALHIVKDCIVLARAEADQKMLVAYVVLRFDGARTDDAAIDVAAACRQHLKERVPSYMLPAAFIVLPAMPVTPNGKVDIKSLLQSAASHGCSSQAAPPRNALDSELAAAWRETLSLESVGIDENFFEVGGHSLATISLATLLKRKYRVDVPVAEMFRFQTIRSLSDAIQNGVIRRDNLALFLNASGSKPPLFFLPPATGVGHCFMRLSQALRRDRAHYAFMTPGQESAEELPQSVESLAAQYLAYVVRHHGVLHQWYLAGYSVGGVVAFEIGRQCLEKGYPPPHLIMLDSYLPRRTPLIPLRPAQILYDVYGSDADQYLVTAKQLVKIFFQYKPQPAPLRVTLLKAKGSNALIYNNRRSWRRYANSGVNVVSVPGGHRTMLDSENVPELAHAFEECFEAHDPKRSDP